MAYHDVYKFRVSLHQRLLFLFIASHPPVYGGWSAWIDHGCCDSGTRRKSRTCTNPSPKHGGRQCTGSRYLTASCNMGCCPGKTYVCYTRCCVSFLSVLVNGGWSQWVSDACNVTCGGGMLTMTREQTALVYQNMRNNAITNVVQVPKAVCVLNFLHNFVYYTI